MLPVWRIAPKIGRGIVTRGLYTGTRTKPNSSEEIPISVLGQPSLRDFQKFVKAYGGIRSVEGVQGDVKTEMSVSVARRVLADAAEYQSEGPSIQGVQESYEPSGEISVPRPSGGGIGNSYGSHLNIPGSGRKLLDKYLSILNQRGHPSRHFSNSSQLLSSMQGAQEYIYKDKGAEDDVCPQGIQGDECVQFKLWLENCQRYHLPNCDEQAHAIETGKKTLAQVFQEQQDIIREVAEAYKKQQEALGVHDQGVQDSPYVCDFDVVSEPCPQGFQGSDCDNLKLWMYNCQQFGFGDCKERLNDVRSGKVDLSDIFEEQDELIRKVVRDHQQKRSYSTDSRNTQNQEVGTDNSSSETNPSTPPKDTVKNLSTRAKLRRAVKDYGRTVIVFHVGISLISLGGFYLAVTR